MRRVWSSLILTLFLAACGSGMRSVDNFGDDKTSAYTQGVNEDGKRYTGFSSRDSLDDLRTLIEEDSNSAENAKLVAQNVEWVRMVSHDKNEAKPKHYEIEIKWKDQRQPQLFRGERSVQEGHVVAQLQPVNAGITGSIDLTCQSISDYECGKGLGVIKMGDKKVGAIEVLRKAMVLKPVAAEESDARALSPEAKKYIEENKAGQPVIAKSFSVVYGPSAVEVLKVTDKGTQTVLATDLLDPDGEQLPLKRADPALAQLGETKLIGNNTNGSLFFLQEDKNSKPVVPTPPVTATNTAPAPNNNQQNTRVQPSPPPAPPASPKKQEFVIVLTEPEAPKPAPPQGPTATEKGVCTVGEKKPAQPLAKALIDEIVDTCDKPNIPEKREFWSKTSPATVKKLLNTYEEAKNNPKSDVARRMKIAIEELEKAHFPTAFLGVTLVESGGFDPTAVGSSGERSEWQIMACTAMGLGILTVKPGGNCRNRGDIAFDGRLDSRIAARAVVKYMKTFFDRWQYRDPQTGVIRQNLPMSLASYNGGPGTTEKASQTAANQIRRGTTGRVVSYGRLSDEQIKQISSDFFFLAKNRIGLSRHQIDYTRKVLAGSQVILDPKSHGFQELEPVSGN